MIGRKTIGMLGIALMAGAIALPVMSSTASAAAITTGLKSLSLQGTGSGAFAFGDCGTIVCSTAGTCGCLSGTDTLVGNNGFKAGQLNFQLSVEEGVGTLLPVSTLGDCFPATGTGSISNKNGKNTVALSFTGLACPATTTTEVFNGTYLVTSGTGTWATASGTGAINGSQVDVSGTSLVSVTGTLQK